MPPLTLPAGRAAAAARLAGRRPRGEAWDQEGRRWVRFAPRSGHATGRAAVYEHQMEFAPEHFSKVRLDYSAWPEKWWREAIQNSVDAGATRIVCGSRPPRLDEPLWEVWCEDDGGGMSREVLLGAFLRFFGTTKGQFGGMRGGFGKAKELLILPWVRWEVRSRDTRVWGVANRYNVETAPELAGTRITAWMAPGWSEYTTANIAQSFIAKCWLPGVQFDLQIGQPDGSFQRESVRADERVGDLIREFSLPDGRVGARLYYDEHRAMTGSQLLVRTGGLYSFYLHISGEIPGTLIAELAVPSVEVLTSNREGFREETGLKSGLEAFTSELAADTRTALKRKANVFKRVYAGSGGLFAATRASRYIADQLQYELEPPREGKPTRLSTGRIQDVVRSAASKLDVVHTTHVTAPPSTGGGSAEFESAPAPRDVGLDLTPSAGAMALALTAARPGGATDFESMLRQLVWTPPFMVWNEIPGFKPASKFFPETMSPTVRRLATTWAELCRLVMVRLGSPEPFGIGWIFSDHQSAGALQDSTGFWWLLLNPLRPEGKIKVQEDYQGEIQVSALRGVKRSKRKQTIWSAGSWSDVRTLFAIAIHEATHAADGISRHNEAFAGALTWNLAMVISSTPVARKLIRQIGRDLGARPGRRVPGEAKMAALAAPDRYPTGPDDLAAVLQRALRDVLREQLEAKTDPEWRSAAVGWTVQPEDRGSFRFRSEGHWSGEAQGGFVLTRLQGFSFEEPRTVREWTQGLRAVAARQVEQDGEHWYWYPESMARG